MIQIDTNYHLIGAGNAALNMACGAIKSNKRISDTVDTIENYLDTVDEIYSDRLFTSAEIRESIDTVNELNHKAQKILDVTNEESIRRKVGETRAMVKRRSEKVNQQNERINRLEKDVKLLKEQDKTWCM